MLVGRFLQVEDSLLAFHALVGGAHGFEQCHLSLLRNRLLDQGRVLVQQLLDLLVALRHVLLNEFVRLQ